MKILEKPLYDILYIYFIVWKVFFFNIMKFIVQSFFFLIFFNFFFIPHGCLFLFEGIIIQQVFFYVFSTLLFLTFSSLILIKIDQIVALIWKYIVVNGKKYPLMYIFLFFFFKLMDIVKTNKAIICHISYSAFVPYPLMQFCLFYGNEMKIYFCWDKYFIQ